MDKKHLMSWMTIACTTFTFSSISLAATNVQERDLGSHAASTSTSSKNNIDPIQTNEVSSTQAQGFDSSTSPSEEAKGEFSDGFKSMGRGFKKGTHATGHAFKKAGNAVGNGFKTAGKAMGQGFKKAGSGIKWFFTGKWLHKKSSGNEENLATSASDKSSETTFQKIPASDLDSVGNDTASDSSQRLVRGNQDSASHFD